MSEVRFACRLAAGVLSFALSCLGAHAQSAIGSLPASGQPGPPAVDVVPGVFPKHWLSEGTRCADIPEW
jgi:hypothetical protein